MYEEQKRLWTDRFNKSLDNIERMMKRNEEYEQDFRFYVHTVSGLLFNDNVNPYEILPKGFESSPFSADGWSEFLEIVHHAFVDDGDITFVEFKNEKDEHYDNPLSFMMSGDEVLLKYPNLIAKHIYLHHDPKRFIEAYNSYSTYIEERRRALDKKLSDLNK